MLFLLYNSNSKIGKNKEKIFKVLASAIKTFKDGDIRVKDITKLDSIEERLAKINKEKDKILIVGGDGTLTSLINKYKKYLDKLPKIYAVKAGTGNDFLRNIIHSGYPVENINNKYFLINPFLKNLPICKVNNIYPSKPIPIPFKNVFLLLLVNNNEKTFLNGIGIGLDGYICKNVEEQRNKNNKQSFFKITLKSFMEFKPLEKLTIEVDGQKHELKKCWFASIMNGKYYGGGMKIAPKADFKGEKLQAIIINDINKFKLFMLFPLIYTGNHSKVKAVHFFEGKHIKITSDEKTYVQIDGEPQKDINEIEVIKNNL